MDSNSYACMHPKSLELYWIFAILWTIACQAPLSMGFSRHEYWGGLQCPLPGDPPAPGIEPMFSVSPALASGFFTTCATWEAPLTGGGAVNAQAWEGHPRGPKQHWKSLDCIRLNISALSWGANMFWTPCKVCTVDITACVPFLWGGHRDWMEKKYYSSVQFLLVTIWRRVGRGWRYRS